MGEYEKGSQSLYNRTGGSRDEKLLVVHGEEKMKQTLTEVLSKTGLYFRKSYFIVRNIHSISYFCFLVTTD